jgi:hypothetical protein
VALAATVLGARQMEVVAQNLEEGGLASHLDFAEIAVDV